jgi:hypothetical protein
MASGHATWRLRSDRPEKSRAGVVEQRLGLSEPAVEDAADRVIRGNKKRIAFLGPSSQKSASRVQRGQGDKRSMLQPPASGR